MSLKAYTNSPEQLIKKIKEAIDEKKITTWSYDSDGDFTHTPDQWKNHCWLRPRIISDNELLFALIGRKKFNVTTTEYAVFHGRFAEMLLTHFDSEFERVELSALASTYDAVKAEE